MTIITKPSNDKSGEKSTVPLFTEGGIAAATAPSLSSSPEDVENPRAEFQHRRKSSATTLFLFLSALAVMCMGILGGIAIYRMYVPPSERMRFHGYCGVPYDSQTMTDVEMARINNNIRAGINSNPLGLDDFNIYRDFPSMLQDDEVRNTFFPEAFELDLSDEESYSKIDVPVFKGGRRGRFLHDFKMNQTCIIDADTSRCFIMPLDRDTVLPPKSLYDLLIKMYDGYYNIDTERVRKNFRVITPELDDLSSVAPRIANECKDKKVYMLEKYVSGVFKRDVEGADPVKFGGFAGKHIVEFGLLNLDEVDQLEKAARK